MKNLIIKLENWLDNKTTQHTNLITSILFLISVGVIFFYPVIFQQKIALPADALVGAHVPWTEIKWADYPAGIPIKNLEITDAFSQFYPWRSLVGEFWREGKVPLWNNYMFSGAPFLAALHTATIYPLNFVYIFFSDINSWNILVFLQITLSMVFMYLFLRELTKDHLSSIFGALAFGFSGYMIAWLEFATGGHAGLWLPLLLLLQYKFSKSKDAKFLLLIPLVVFFMLTAGDFQVPFYSLATYAGFSIFLTHKSFGKLKLLISYLYALVLGILLSFIQWLPSLELFSRSIRVSDPYIKEYFYGIAHWEKTVNFIWPDFFGNVVTGNYWGKYGYHEYMAFAGSVSLALLAFSLFTKKSSIEKFFFSVLIVSLLFLFPTPLAFLPFELGIPGLGTSSASRIIFLVDFCIALLAAFALSKLRAQNVRKFNNSLFYLLVITSGVALGLFITLYLLTNSHLDLAILKNIKVAFKNLVPSSLILVTAFLATYFFRKITFIKINNLKLMIVFLLVVEMLRFGWKNTPFSDQRFVFPDTKTTEFLQANSNEYRISGGIPLNLFMPYKIKSLEGYDPIYPYVNSEWYSQINSRSFNALSGRYGIIHDFSSPLLDLSSVRYVVDYRKNNLGQFSEKGSYAAGIVSPKYKEVFEDGRVKVFENTESLPIAWLTNKYIVEPDKQQTFNLLGGDDFIRERRIIFAESPDVNLDEGELTYTIKDFEMELNEVKVNVENSADAFLFLSQTYDPGWKAYVNGEVSEVFRSDYLYQSVFVPKGQNNVQFVYEPKSYKIGRNIFLTTLIVIAVSCVVLYKKSNST